MLTVNRYTIAEIILKVPIDNLSKHINLNSHRTSKMIKY